MVWWKVDDGFYDHPKVQVAGNEAAGLWCRAANWSAKHNTDGFVPTSQWAALAPANWRRLTKVLLNARAGRTHGLIEEAEGGFVIHDFLADNPSREKVLAEKAKRGELRGSDVTAAVKRRDGNFCRYCGDEVNWRDRRGAKGGTYDHVEPGLAGGVDNLVVACRSCNAIKAGRTPAGAGLVLRPAPEPKSRLRSVSRSDLGLDQAPDLGPDLGAVSGSDDLHAGRDGSGGSGSRSGQVGSGGSGQVPGSGPADETEPPPAPVRDDENGGVA